MKQHKRYKNNLGVSHTTKNALLKFQVNMELWLNDDFVLSQFIVTCIFFTCIDASFYF